MKNPPTKKAVAKELSWILSNSLIFVVISVMLFIPIYPISKQIKLEIKARTNHNPNEIRNSEPAINNSLHRRIMYDIIL
jgi:hypothetical protein